MRKIIITSLISLSTSVLAGEVPKEFLGEWVPKRMSCESPLRMIVKPDHVILQSDMKRKYYGNLDICYSCAGGSKYDGRQVWVHTEFFSETATGFVIMFNDNERKGIAKIQDIQNADLKHFPLNNVDLKKCK